MELNKKNKVLQDPLSEKNILPKFAYTLKFNHWSPTSLMIGDGSFIFKYLFLTQAQRRLLPANSQMKSGVACGDAVQDVLADVKWKLNSANKLSPVNHTKLTKEASLQKAIEKFKEYQPVDEKDQAKKDHYLETIPMTVHQIFLALEKLVGDPVSAPTVTCEKHLSVSDPRLLVDIIGRSDFEFGSFQDGVPSPDFFLVELKTVWDRFGKQKKDGSYSLIRSKLPSKPSENHLCQCAFYSKFYDYKFPIYLLYANSDDHEIYDSTNCAGLTKEGLKQNYNKLVSIAKRRERMLSRYDNLDRDSIIQNICADTDPNWSHPYLWNIGPEFLKAAKELWNLQ